ncbi:MAG: N-acyl-D-amino-acid deacylase [Bryobacteraceae bacterium]|nr:MAG: N-acyl-D-amino-acid deacylase [Bryobacteraceae bacterium]
MRSMRWMFCLAAFVLPLAAQPYDVLIRNARVIDGTGAGWFRSSVAVRGGSIAAIGPLDHAEARTVIDARGLVLAPGFIDAHSHALAGLRQHPDAENLIRQGVTTVMEGQDGSSPLPLRDVLEEMDRLRPAVNIGFFAGHGTIRTRVMKTEMRAPTIEELDRMKALLEQAMRDGAFGLSTGLFYVPGNYATTEEVIELARVAASLGGMHISHMRDETAGVVASVAETIRIGEEGGLPTQVTHHKIIGKANWGRSAETLRLISEARARGVDVTLDAYPYTASSTGTGALFPQWALSGGAQALAERLSAPETRARIRAEIVRRILEDRGGGDPANVVLASCRFDPSLAGKSLADLARARGLAPTAEAAADIAIELQRRGGCSAIYHAISEDDVERILAYRWTMIASDGGVVAPGEGAPHPRNYGTFARVLGRYVRQRKLMPLEEAVWKMTGLPAQRLGLWDRGLIRPGMRADLVLFDPERIADRATFAEPHQYAEGVVAVWVNGVETLREGKMTGSRGGHALRGPAGRR